MKYEFSANGLEKISADVAVVFALSEEKAKKAVLVPLSSFNNLDTTLKGQLTKAAEVEQFKGKRGESLSLLPQTKISPSRVVVIGLGKKKDLTAQDIRKVTGTFAKRYRITIDSASFDLPKKSEVGIEIEEIIHALYEGLTLGSYVFSKYKKEEKNERDFATIIIANQASTKQLNEAADRAQAYANATKLARDLVNEQPTIATPTFLAKLAEDIAQSSDQIQCTVYDREEVEKMGMEAFLGIARAADTPPKFIHLEYTPKKAKQKEKLAIIGKGITFDSGGINVKPGDHMSDMKMDMAGAAIVLGIFSVITKIQPAIPVIGLIAATPNMISGKSLVPGDVVRAMNGKTIEILNTDAEGRVTMADSLSYAIKQEATQLIDFATLTGACMVALGEDVAGLFTNDSNLGDKVKAASEKEGEKMWELPLDKDYKKLNKSEVADIANVGSGRYAGAITAALFLEEFVDSKPWVHMDIAGPAFTHKGTEICPKGGTGFGVRTTLRMLETF